MYHKSFSDLEHLKNVWLFYIDMLYSFYHLFTSSWMHFPSSCGLYTALAFHFYWWSMLSKMQSWKWTFPTRTSFSKLWSELLYCHLLITVTKCFAIHWKYLFSSHLILMINFNFTHLKTCQYLFLVELHYHCKTMKHMFKKPIVKTTKKITSKAVPIF